VTVRAEELSAGDSIVFLGRAHRITSIDPYDGPLGDIFFGVARSYEDWAYSLIRGGVVEVAS
jgi:hypothetical protein